MAEPGARGPHGRRNLRGHPTPRRPPVTVFPTAWLALIGAIGVLLVIDLLVVGRRGGEMSLRFASLASVVGRDRARLRRPARAARRDRAAADYTAGYLVEKSLSLDNVFVFLLVFGAFGVARGRAPPAADLRHRRRARHARGLHRDRRRRARALQLDRLRLRRAADLHGLEHVPPPPRPRQRGGAGRQAPRASRSPRATAAAASCSCAATASAC